jgi:hypothetical protein
MESLQQDFDELRQRLKRGRNLEMTGDDPVFYLIFRPEQMLIVKQRLKQWRAKLELEGWKVHLFSMADAVHQILQNHDLREIWLESEQEDPLAFREINDTLADALMADDALKNALDDKLQLLAGIKTALLLITDLEALHPYLRVGTLEQKLQGRFTVPTVILYPGVRTGRTTLRFLGIYPEDGNYRSTHIGGF